MEIGCRAHDFGRLPLGELAGRIAEKGFATLQLAPAKALAEPDCRSGPPPPELASRIAAGLGERGLRVAVLGAYYNPVHPDVAERARGKEIFKAYLGLGASFGCPLVGTETGSLNPDCSPHPGNRGEKAFALLIEELRGLALEAEKTGSLLCIEGVASHVLSTPSRIGRALDELGSASVRVILDLANLLDLENNGQSERIVEEAFELFGDRIAVLHAKDLGLSKGRLCVLPFGQGMIDWLRVFRLLKKVKPEAELILEDLAPQAMDAALALARETWARA
jgi:sugar phosphate isomerase/epimerase